MKLRDCVTTDPTQAELLLVFSDRARAAAWANRDRFTQAVLPLDQSFSFTGELIDDLDNTTNQSLIAAVGTGIFDTIDLSNLRYQKIILVDEDSDEVRAITGQEKLFFNHYMRTVVDNGSLLAPITPLRPDLTQEEFDENVLDRTTRRLGPI